MFVKRDPHFLLSSSPQMLDDLVRPRRFLPTALLLLVGLVGDEVMSFAMENVPSGKSI